jgi:hypothetical protein
MSTSIRPIVAYRKPHLGGAALWPDNARCAHPDVYPPQSPPPPEIQLTQPQATDHSHIELRSLSWGYAAWRYSLITPATTGFRRTDRRSATSRTDWGFDVGRPLLPYLMWPVAVVMDQVLAGVEAVAQVHGEVAGLLHRPCPVRVPSHPGKVESSGAVLDEHQHYNRLSSTVSTTKSHKR